MRIEDQPRPIPMRFVLTPHRDLYSCPYYYDPRSALLWTCPSQRPFLRKALIEKLPDPEDGRAFMLRVTRSGRALARRWPESFAAVARVLSAEDQAALLGIVIRAIDALQREGAISRQRMCMSCCHFAPNRHRSKSKPHHCRFIDAALGEGDLRLDCAEHEEAEAA
ncbi:MAG: winged helix-turn-helix transcriptional regulator [Caulobacteraceae bacterium]|nr:winged helix-turn-helix transcriptional regulator [Caulobacteraceae bacterium]